MSYDLVVRILDNNGDEKIIVILNAIDYVYHCDCHELSFMKLCEKFDDSHFTYNVSLVNVESVEECIVMV